MMKRYIVFRLLFVIINVFLIASILYYSLNFANIIKWSDLSFKQVMPIVNRMYKVFLQERLIKLDWGLTVMGDSVRETVVPKFWVSLKYNLIALLVYFPIGVLIGIASAYWKNSIFDHLFNTITLTFGSIPTYILTFLLVVVLGFQLELFPAHFSEIPQTPLGKIWGLGIPIIALSASAISKISRVIRDEMSESIQSEYYLLARTKGLTKYQTFLRHTLRNSIAAALPVMMDVFLLVLMGSFFVEMVFGIRGVAEVLYDSLIKPFDDLGFNYISIDVNVVVMVCTFYMLVAYVFSFIIDIAYTIIDPRIKLTRI